MAELPTSIGVDVIISGVVSLLLAGSIIKRVVEGYLEARKRMSAQSNGPMITAMGSLWDRDQQEKLIILVERMTLALESQARYQGSIADQQQHYMQEKIDRLLEKMEYIPTPKRKGP